MARGPGSKRRAWKRTGWGRALGAAGDRAVASTLLGALAGVGRLPPDRALGLAHAIGMRLGPRSARHRLVLDNLALAFPGREEAERARIGREMWGHQARLLVEAAMLERLFDWSPGAPAGRIEVEDRLDVAARAAAGTPTVMFTGHLGCFEMLPRMATAIGLDMMSLFRPPNNRRLAVNLMEKRAETGGRFVSSARGTAQALVRQLDGGGSVGLLVDQKFRRGPMIPFMDVPAPTNELSARLAARMGGYVPARCVRLPNNRYRIAIEPVVPVAKDAPVEDTLVGINALVGRWVREHPEQWMWFHRRWG